MMVASPGTIGIRTAVAVALVIAAAIGAGACHPRGGTATPSPPRANENRPPSVRVRCEPCRVDPGKTSMVSAEARDPDGDALSYAWAAPGGTVAEPSNERTQWTAPMTEGPVPVTITVSDGKGGTATDAITIQVTKS